MASELTVYKNIFTGYSSKNRFWGVFLFFLKLLFYSRGFQNTTLSDCFNPLRWEDYLCGLGTDMLLVFPLNFCVLNCLHFMVVHLLANNVLG